MFYVIAMFQCAPSSPTDSPREVTALQEDVIVVE